MTVLDNKYFRPNQNKPDRQVESKNFWTDNFTEMVMRINAYAEETFSTTVNVNFVRVEPDGVHIR